MIYGLGKTLTYRYKHCRKLHTHGAAFQFFVCFGNKQQHEYHILAATCTDLQ